MSDARLTRPEHHCGFLGAAVAMQLIYLNVARDAGGRAGQLAFFVPVPILWLQKRAGAAMLAFASVDFALAIAFVWASLRTDAEERRLTD